jgi:aldose 1-epimerase
VSGVERDRFGTTRDGEAVWRFTLANRRGTRARWITLGATLTELHVADRDGVPADVVLGFDDVAGYESGENPYFGCTVGRVANRIAGARFELDGVAYALAANDGPNHLHGGRGGFGRALWRGDALACDDGPALRFTHTSPDGDEGYPGTLAVEVDVVLDHQDGLRIEYRATTDAATPVNLTNHTYWNLAGGGDVRDHELRLDAEHYTEVGPGLVPTGRILPVAGTPLDFGARKPVGRDLDRVGGGYDHNFVLAPARRARAVAAGELLDPGSGRRLRFATTEPGVQLYTGNVLDGLAGKRGARYRRHAGLCLEAQGFPDAPNQPGFPSVVLRPGQTYRQTTVYRFGSG